MSTSDVSDTVLKRLDSGKISWPSDTSERNKFIEERLGKVWDTLLDINISANVEVYSHLEQDTSYCGTCESASGQAWDGLSEVLMLILVLEDTRGIDITPSLKYDKPEEFSRMKAKIRARVQS